MAEFVNPVGKIRGKYGNVIGYVRKNGKNYCKSAGLKRKPNGEVQKRQSIAFATTTERKRWLMVAIRLGFPGGNGYPKGFNGFVSANVTNAVEVERVDPEKPISVRKKAGREFRGEIDYRKLRVAAGQLVPPSVSAEVDAENRKVHFTSPGEQLELIDCFLDDKIYGVVAGVRNKRCHVVELGARGEAIGTSVDFPRDVEADELVVYVFAAGADGKDVSDSVCLCHPE